MGRLRFVQPKIVRVPLSDGDFIDIKSELTAGEEREAYAYMCKSLVAGTPPQLDPERVELASLRAYIVGWSFTDTEGQPVAVSEDSMLSIDADTFAEIYFAIVGHEKALAAKKKIATGNGSAPPSASPVAVTGPTTTS